MKDITLDSVMKAKILATLLAQERYSGNPVIEVAHNPKETRSQYVPAPVSLPNGDIWVYVKGDSSCAIWAYKSTDGGRTFTLQNRGNPVIQKGASGEWDSGCVIEPSAVFDKKNNIIHLFYKGSMLFDKWSWAHATAPVDNPTAFTKDPANPILTPSAIETTFGEVNVTDNAISDVIKIGNDFYFYGYFRSNSGFKIFYARGTDWNNPTPQDIIITSAQGFEMVQCPSVFRFPSSPIYVMIFTEGSIDKTKARYLRAALSLDGKTWECMGDTILTPSKNTWENIRVYAASLLKKSGGDFSEPEVVDGRLLLYYSGSSSITNQDNAGLLYMFLR